MNRNAPVFAVLLLISGLVTAQEVPPAEVTGAPVVVAPSPAVVAVRQPVDVVDLFHLSMREGNTARALEQLTEDVSIFESGFVEFGRRQYAVRNLIQDGIFASHVERRVLRRESWQQDGVAGVLTFSVNTGDYEKRKIALEQTETMILRNTADGWRISHIHWSAHSIASP